VITAGQSIGGTLTASDVKRPDGSYTHGFFYDAAAGETVVIGQRSADFDSWLVLDDPNSPLEIYDDDDGGGNDSKLTVTFPHTGRYLLLVNTVIAAATGSYTLSVQPASSAEAAWSRELEGYFTKIDPMFANRGYHPTGFLRTGTLSAGAENRGWIAAQKKQWALIGECDRNCSDLDLQLVDKSGNVVATDQQTDDYPLLTVDPGADEGYTVIVKMAKCAASACYFRLRQYAK
jgi:hypothetical protein